MIKVNLLRDQTARTRKTLTAPRPSPMGLLALMIFAPVALGIGGAWYYLHAQIGVLTISRNELQVENNRLKQLRKQIDEYEKLKAERQGRIDIIEQLKANQKGPVLLMNHVIRSIPTGAAFWLTTLEQKGDQVKITGFTVRGETIPDFMSNLAATGFFRTVDLELYEDQEKESAKFTLVCVSERKALTE